MIVRSRNSWHVVAWRAFSRGMPNLDKNEENRIVAVGLLTRREVANVGAHLSRLYPIEDCSAFADLLEAIDEADREYHLEENKRPG